MEFLIFLCFPMLLCFLFSYISLTMYRVGLVFSEFHTFAIYQQLCFQFLETVSNSNS